MHCKRKSWVPQYLSHQEHRNLTLWDTVAVLLKDYLFRDNMVNEQHIADLVTKLRNDVTEKRRAQSTLNFFASRQRSSSLSAACTACSQ